MITFTSKNLSERIALKAIKPKVPSTLLSNNSPEGSNTFLQLISVLVILECMID